MVTLVMVRFKEPSGQALCIDFFSFLFGVVHFLESSIMRHNFIGVVKTKMSVENVAHFTLFVPITTCLFAD